MPLAIKTYEQFVQDEVAAIQAALPGFFRFPVGSIVRAIVDAHAGTALWEESLVQFVLARTRLSTSTGQDADTFVEDFGLKRLPAVASSGNVTFSSYTPTQQRIIPVTGTTVTTQDGKVSYGLVVDTANPNYNAGLNAYVMAPNVASITVPVKALVAGVIGNVTANTITVINSPIPGVDIVTNPQPFTNGKEKQTDNQLRAYFVQYINSRSEATKAALAFAIQSLGENVKFSLTENVNYSTGDPELGTFYAVVDDGSGAPPSPFLQQVEAAMELVRGFTIISQGAYAPNEIPVSVSATITIPVAYSSSSPDANSALQADIITALETYIDLVPFGETIYYARLIQIIYNVIAADAPTYIADTNVSNVLLNGLTADLPSTPKDEFTLGTFTINITN